MGTRTHFRVGSHFNWRAHLAQQVARNATGGPTTSVLYCFNPYVGQCETEAMTLGLRPNPKRGHPAYMLNPALISALNTMEKLFSRRPRSPRRMLTGNAAVAMAVAMCERVDLFGFGNDSDATEDTDTDASDAIGHYESSGESSDPDDTDDEQKRQRKSANKERVRHAPLYGRFVMQSRAKAIEAAFTGRTISSIIRKGLIVKSL